MLLGDRIGMLSMISTFFGLGATYLWPAERWIGWSSLILSLILILIWAYLELRNRAVIKFLSGKKRVISYITVMVVLLAGLFWTLNRPTMKVLVMAGFFGEVWEHEPTTAVTIIVRLMNTGEPSIANNWSLSVRLANGETAFSSMVDRSQATLMGPRDQSIIPLPYKPIEEQVSHTPLPTGASVDGKISFLFEGYRRDVLSTPGNLITLQFQDVNGRTYKSAPLPMPAKNGPR